MNYETETYKLTANGFEEKDRKAVVVDDSLLIDANGEMHFLEPEKGLPVLHTKCPIINAMYKVSEIDHQKCVIDPHAYYYAFCTRRFNARFKPELLPDDNVFWVGDGFNTLIYTRDTSYASYLGTCWLYPEVVRSHLHYTRYLRRYFGLVSCENFDIPEQPEEIRNLTRNDAVQKWNTTLYERRTDDIVWILGFWEYCKMSQSRTEMKWMLDEFDYYDENFYQYFFKKEVGLYCGQPSFIDIGGTGYPGYSGKESIEIQALSTNCLYARAFDILAKVCGILDLPERKKKFEERAADIKKEITTRFLGDDGYYHYYLGKYGELSDRRETLGLSFLKLFDILPEEEAKKALDTYPGGDYGVPLFWPFYDGTHVYHNLSTWPFADMLFSKAKWHCGKSKKLLMEILGKSCRHALNGNFNEVLEYKTGNFIGCPGYIWSSASYLTVIYDFLAGIDLEEIGKVKFDPFLPEELGDLLILKGMKIGHMSLDLEIHGNGDKISAMYVDGNKVEKPELNVDEEKHSVRIELE